jgi:antitoxin HicB
MRLGYNRISVKDFSESARQEEGVMKRLVVVINSDPEDGGYVATVPSLPGVVGQGETEEEAFEDVKAALEFTLESMIERGEELPSGEEVAREVELAI